MAKYPWSDEPTPLCEKASMDGCYWTDQGSRIELVPSDYKRASNGEVVFIDVAQDLERRLRYASRLLGTIRIDCMLDGPDGTLDPELLEQRLGELEETLAP